MEVKIYSTKNVFSSCGGHWWKQNIYRAQTERLGNCLFIVGAWTWRQADRGEETRRDPCNCWRRETETPEGACVQITGLPASSEWIVFLWDSLRWPSCGNSQSQWVSSLRQLSWSGFILLFLPWEAVYKNIRSGWGALGSPATWMPCAALAKSFRSTLATQFWGYGM